jgi:hypothetical protein
MILRLSLIVVARTVLPLQLATMNLSYVPPSFGRPLLILYHRQVHHLRIPRFLVQDDSYINVSENKTSVADAIADSSLSEHSAEVSV